MDRIGSDRSPFFKKVLLLIICAIAGTLVSTIILAVFAAVITASGSYSSLAKLAVLSAAFTSGLVSGFIAAKNLRGRGFITGALASFLCAMIMALLSFIPATGTGGGLVSLAVCVAGGITGGIIGANMSKAQ